MAPVPLWQARHNGFIQITSHYRQFQETSQQRPSQVAKKDAKIAKNVSSQSGTRKEKSFMLQTLCLFRAAVADHDQSPSSTRQESEEFRLELAEMVFVPNRVGADTLMQIRRQTAEHPVLAALHTVIMNGWPSETKHRSNLRVYWNFRDEISVFEGVLFRSHQAIVPASLRPEMSRKIHKAHQGTESSIRRARESLFWSGMQAAIRGTCLSCGLCAPYLSERPQEPMKSHDTHSTLVENKCRFFQAGWQQLPRDGRPQQRPL